ncbi:MAG: hypothetical protein QNJ47_27935 [Nostocaceae cyanobacterium]|nr:hypothetical protein [Nostocaceae cyanobacterium]
MDVYIHGKRIKLNPRHAIGKGGEADVFDIGKGKALKLFKSPSHPDYQGLPHEQKAARERLQIHQQKLPAFPCNLPQKVIAPEELVTDKNGKTILGYTMPFIKDAEVLLKYGERSFRQGGVSQQTVVSIFKDLRETVSQLHFAGIVIGDFNDLNVLIKGIEAYFIDADSFQFGSFPCQVFTARFVDPILCDAKANQPLLKLPHNSESDWYAFTVMLMQSLLFVEPYGGVYKPKTPSEKIPHAARPLHRITIFHPQVRYPKPAIPYKVLPDELLHYFHQVFEKDIRGEFPQHLLENLHWTKCTNCGTEHGRPTCPDCTHPVPSTIKSVTVVRGKVTATRLFSTEGLILFATVEKGKLYWLYHDRGEFRREDNSLVLNGDLNPHLQWRIQGKTTFLGYQGQIISFHPDKELDRLAVDSYKSKTVFDVNPNHRYWILNGQLQRDNNLGTTYIGEVLPEQTQFWVGSHFGFGFYRAGELNIAFVFDTQKPGINDQVQLPSLQGQLIHTNCTFSQDYCWLFLTTQEQGKICYRCVVIQANGSIAATTQAHSGEDNWLTTLGNGNHLAAGNFLLAATDEGIIRIELQQGQLIQTKTFPDTEPFVNTASQLLPAPHGLYVVNSQQIYQLQIA